eukprot:g1624.t1
MPSSSARPRLVGLCTDRLSFQSIDDLCVPLAKGLACARSGLVPSIRGAATAGKSSQENLVDLNIKAVTRRFLATEIWNPNGYLISASARKGIIFASCI